MSKKISELSTLSSKPSRLGAAIVVMLCFTLAYTTLLFGAVDTGTITLLSITSSLVIILWVADGWKSQELKFYTSKLYFPILGIIAVGVVQLLPLSDMTAVNQLLNVNAAASLSLDPYATRFFLIRLTLYLIFFAAALTFIHTESRIRRVATAVIIFGSIMAFLGILQWLTKPEAIYGLRLTPQSIPFGPFINQHHFAALMEMTSGLTLGLLFGDGVKRDKKPLFVIAAILMAVSIVLTGSRGGLLSYVGVIVFTILASIFLRRGRSERGNDQSGSDGNRRFLLFAGASAIVFLAIGMVLFLGGEESLFRGSGLQNADADITSGRAYFWGIAWQIFMSHPFIGAGFDGFGAAFTALDTANGLLRVEQAHNDYLQMLADGGIAAFACVAAFIYLLFKKSLKVITLDRDRLRRSIAVGGLAGCFGILIHSFFDFPLRTPANGFFFLTLVTLASVHLKHIKNRHAE